MKPINTVRIVLLVFLSLSWPGHQPALAQPTLTEAKQALDAGKYDQAETHLRQIVNQQPESAEAYFNLGLSLHLQMDLKEAIKSYQQAIQLDPTYDQPYTNMGLALIEANQLEEASTVFRQVLSLPERSETPASIHTLAHYNLAIILKRKGQLAAAQKEVEAALAITPDFAQAQKLRKLLF